MPPKTDTGSPTSKSEPERRRGLRSKLPVKRYGDEPSSVPATEPAPPAESSPATDATQPPTTVSKATAPTLSSSKAPTKSRKRAAPSNGGGEDTGPPSKAKKARINPPQKKSQPSQKKSQPSQKKAGKAPAIATDQDATHTAGQTQNEGEDESLGDSGDKDQQSITQQQHRQTSRAAQSRGTTAAPAQITSDEIRKMDDDDALAALEKQYTSKPTHIRASVHADIHQLIRIARAYQLKQLVDTAAKVPEGRTDITAEEQSSKTWEKQRGEFVTAANLDYQIQRMRQHAEQVYMDAGLLRSEGELAVERIQALQHALEIHGWQGRDRGTGLIGMRHEDSIGNNRPSGNDEDGEEVDNVTGAEGAKCGDNQHGDESSEEAETMAPVEGEDEVANAQGGLTASAAEQTDGNHEDDGDNA